jgi:hypothetical protein
MGLLADDEPIICGDIVPSELVDLDQKGIRIDDHAVSNDARDARMQDSRWNQPQNELRATDVHGVAGIVTALVACDDGKMWRKEIDNLAFPFIAPLSTHDSQVSGDHS